MTSMNLAIVFGPNLMWSKSQAASLDAMAQVNSFTLLLLENIRVFFETGWLEMIQSFLLRIPSSLAIPALYIT